MAQYAALACFEPQTLTILEERRAEVNGEPFDWNQEKQFMAMPAAEESTQH